MNVAKRNLFLDILASISMLSLILTGIIIRFALPPGSGRHRLLWDMSRHQWGDVHFWLAVGFGIIVVLHVASHWSCVINMFSPRRNGECDRVRSRMGKYVAGLITLLILALLLVVFWRVSVRHVRDFRGIPSHAEYNIGSQKTGMINGSMTLAEVSESTGLSIQEIKQRLGLPDSVSERDRLGQLSRRYGFTMSEVRKQLSDEKF